MRLIAGFAKTVTSNNRINEKASTIKKPIKKSKRRTRLNRVKSVNNSRPGVDVTG
jgi:hypothetical protein